MIIVSHSMEDVAEYCDNLTVLKGGETLLSGRCAEVFEHEDMLTESGLGVPQITRFMRLLRERGVKCDTVYTVDAAFEEIKRLLLAKNVKREGDE